MLEMLSGILSGNTQAKSKPEPACVLPVRFNFLKLTGEKNDVLHLD